MANHQVKLSISDWISFLSAEKSSNTSNIFSLAAFVIAALALIISQDSSNTTVTAINVIAGAVMLFTFYSMLSKLFGRRAKAAGKLLDDIMSGKEMDVLKMEEEWRNLLAEENRKKKAWYNRPLSFNSRFRNRSAKNSLEIDKDVRR